MSTGEIRVSLGALFSLLPTELEMIEPGTVMASLESCAERRSMATWVAMDSAATARWSPLCFLAYCLLRACVNASPRGPTMATVSCLSSLVVGPSFSTPTPETALLQSEHSVAAAFGCARALGFPLACSAIRFLIKDMVGFKPQGTKEQKKK